MAQNAPNDPMDAPTDQQLAELLEATRKQLREGTQLARSVDETSRDLFRPLRAVGTTLNAGLGPESHESQLASTWQTLHNASAEGTGAAGVSYAESAGVGGNAGAEGAGESSNAGAAQADQQSALAADPLAGALSPDDPAQLMFVVAQIPDATEAVDVAGRLVTRANLRGTDANLLLGGAKTVLPGDGLRLRSAGDLQRQIDVADGQASLVTVIVDSPVETHARAARKLLEGHSASLIWAVWDARRPRSECITWLASQPLGLRIDAIALHHVWESRHVGEYRDLPVRLAWLDAAPATDALWAALAKE